MTAINTLKKWFSNFKKPNQEQFWAWIDSFWHKSEQIPMSSIDGLDRIIEGTASAQQLQNHLSDTHAHKGLFDGKVDKVEGKGLSSNDFTNAYKQQLDTLEDYDIELDESTTELKFKKGNNVVRRISLMFLDDEGTKLVYNRTGKTLELRDKRDNLLTSIPVSHFVSNIPTGIVVQNGKIKLMAGSEVIDENAISYNDLADKPELNYLPLSGGSVNGDINLNGDLLVKDNTKIHVRDNGNIVFGNKPFNDLVIGEFKGIQLWGQGNDKVVLAGGEVTNLSELKNENIKVGGRNLITDSKNERYKEYKGTVEDYIYYGIVGGTLEKNTTYTLSLEYKSENIRSVEMFFINEGFSQAPNKKIPNTNGEWKRETLTFTTDANLSPKGSIRIDNNGSDTGDVTSKLWIRNVKLEKGNIATDWSPAPEDLAWYDDILRAGVECTQNTTLQKEHQNQTLFVTVPCNIELNTIDDLSSVSFRKVFDSGVVSFSCNGKNIIYTTDNQFNGKKGSTAVISRCGNDCYIDIRNI